MNIPTQSAFAIWLSSCILFYFIGNTITLLRVMRDIKKGKILDCVENQGGTLR